ncbi:MAG: 2-dehydropantoate 2-reductase [Alphaproteobacteria bacterium]|nr:2-dehydropantoate 2-reductase [Alphaproteobacteria bacterium]
MRVAVMAAGAVGGIIGARLAQSGHDVHFLARGAHLEAIRAAGLRIESPSGNFTLSPAQATDRPAEIGPVDLVVFAVKFWDAAAAARACRPLLAPGTAVLPLMNGVEALHLLQTQAAPAHALGGVAYVAAVIAAPGVIRQTGRFCCVVFGKADGRSSPRCEAIRAALTGAGIEATIAPDIARAVWEKFVLLAPLAAVTAAARSTVGAVVASSLLRTTLSQAIAEAVAVGRAGGVALADDAAARALAIADGMPKDMKTSLLQDLERGGRLEVPWLSGAVSRLGAERRVATPVCDTLNAVLAPLVRQDG